MTTLDLVRDFRTIRSLLQFHDREQIVLILR